MGKKASAIHFLSGMTEELWFANDDIPMNVLCRLPTKTLLALKLVSKQWSNLIADRTFVRLQLKKTETIAGFFFQQRFQWCDDDINRVTYISVGEGDRKLDDTVLDFLPKSTVILGSCNGLICCRSCLPSSHPEIYVCNPVNKEWTSLHWPNPDRRRKLALAFDPFQDPIDVSTKFKIVALCQTETDLGDYQFQFDLYSSESGKWSRSEEMCCCNDELIKDEGIFVGGVLYWLTDGNEILMFDPENELSCLIKVPIPATEFSVVPQSCMGESEGRLHYVLMSQYGLQLWMLQDHFASEWELRCSVSLAELEQENSRFLYNLAEKLEPELNRIAPWVDTLSFKDGILLMRVSTNVYTFGFETRKMRELCSLSALGPISLFSPIVVPYTMSLVPLS